MTDQYTRLQWLARHAFRQCDVSFSVAGEFYSPTSKKREDLHKVTFDGVTLCNMLEKEAIAWLTERMDRYVILHNPYVVQMNAENALLMQKMFAFPPAQIDGTEYTFFPGTIRHLLD